MTTSRFRSCYLAERLSTFPRRRRQRQSHRPHGVSASEGRLFAIGLVGSTDRSAERRHDDGQNSAASTLFPSRSRTQHVVLPPGRNRRGPGSASLGLAVHSHLAGHARRAESDRSRLCKAARTLATDLHEHSRRGAFPAIPNLLLS